MKVVQVVVHRLDVVQNVADSVLVVAGCVVVEQSVADSALVVVQNVADSALRVVLECVCRPLRDTGVQLLAYTGGGDQLVGAFQSRADAGATGGVYIYCFCTYSTDQSYSLNLVSEAVLLVYF